jgi:hypothetical protein
VVLVLATTASGWTQTYSLTEEVKAGDCFHLQINMRLTGEMRVHKDGMIAPLKLEANAIHSYPERVLVVGAGTAIEKTARIYETAQAVIQVAGDRSERTLRPDRRLMVIQRQKDQGLVYSPAGALLRSELDLTSEHFDSLTLPGVLPGKIVAIGDTWKLSSAVVQALCLFEGLTDQTVTGKLESVKEDVATFSLTGTATGIDVGAQVKLTIEATGQFDLKTKRLASLDWKQKDERDQGPVSPVTLVDTTYTIRRKVIDQPTALSDVALVSVPDSFAPPAPLVQLEFRDAANRFSLVHGREWHVVAQTKEHVVMRLMDRGDFIAQVTLTPWSSAAKGMHLTPEEFRTAMNETSGWKPDKELQTGVVPAEDGRWIYRICALGQMEGIEVLQYFYLIAAPTGEQLVLAFTMTPKQADKLGARDLALVGSIDFQK